MTPTEARDLILRDHVQIRILLTEMNTACRTAFDSGGDGELRAQVRELVRVLWDHLAFEDRLLWRQLTDSDAWGPVRAEAMAAEHGRQRAELAELVEAAHVASGEALAGRVARFIAELRTDMDAEERNLAACLRDDVVAIDQSDG